MLSSVLKSYFKATVRKGMRTVQRGDMGMAVDLNGLLYEENLNELERQKIQHRRSLLHDQGKQVRTRH